jgi:ankyrin repeat protein
MMGRTPLHVAASAGHTDLVKWLLKATADPAMKDKQGNTPLNDAVLAKRDRVAQLIRQEHPSQRFLCPFSGVLMCQAAFNGALADIKRFILNGVSVNEADYDGRTALHLAACEGHVECVEYLLENKANVESKDRFGGTPLEDAVRHNFDVRNVKQVQTILRGQGSSLKNSLTNYIIKMCEFAATGMIEKIMVLSENGVDVGQGDYDGRTPLHLAACNGQTAVLELLLRQQTVVINAVDRFGGTPYEDALRHERKGAAAILEEAGGIRTGDPRLKDVVLKQDAARQAKQKATQEPKVEHMVNNSQESSALRLTTGKLSTEIAEQRSKVETILQRVVWAIKGLDARLKVSKGNIPLNDREFLKSANHLLELSNTMREVVIASRAALDAEMGSEEGPVDCLIWKHATKVYMHEAEFLDRQLRGFLIVARSIRRITKEVVKLSKRQRLAASDGSPGRPGRAQWRFSPSTSSQRSIRSMSRTRSNTSSTLLKPVLESHAV